MATYAITLNERTASGRALKAYLQALGVFISKSTPKARPKARVYDPETGLYMNDRAVRDIELALDDAKHGRLKTYDSVDDFFKEMGL